MRRPSGSGSSRSLGGQPPRPLGDREAAREQVVDRAGAVGSPSPKRSRSVANGSGSSAGRRLRSPPNTSGSAPDHSHRRRRGGHAPRARRLLGPPGRRRAGSPRRARRRRAARARAHCIRRRSGRQASVSRAVLERSGPGGAPGSGSSRPPGGDQVRVRGRRARPAAAGSQLREVSARTPLEPRAAARARASQRGGASCSSATSQSRPSSTRGELVEQRPVDLHVGRVALGRCAAGASAA